MLDRNLRGMREKRKNDRGKGSDREGRRVVEVGLEGKRIAEELEEER